MTVLFKVKAHVRRENAIGVFYRHACVIDIDPGTQEQLHFRAIDVLRLMGYETRNIESVRLTERG